MVWNHCTLPVVYFGCVARYEVPVRVDCEACNPGSPRCPSAAVRWLSPQAVHWWVHSRTEVGRGPGRGPSVECVAV